MNNQTPTRTVEFETTTPEGASFLDAVTGFYEAKQMIKEIKLLQEKYEAVILEAMGEADTAKIDGVLRATISLRNRSNLNKALIPAEIIAAATTNTPYTVLKAE